MERETLSNKADTAKIAVQNGRIAKSPVPSRDRLLLLLLSEALRGRIDVWIPNKKLTEALRAAESRLSPRRNVFFCSDPQTAKYPCLINEELGLLADLGFVEWNGECVRLTALGGANCLHFELSEAWATLVPFIREQLGIDPKGK